MTKATLESYKAFLVSQGCPDLKYSGPGYDLVEPMESKPISQQINDLLAQKRNKEAVLEAAESAGADAVWVKRAGQELRAMRQAIAILKAWHTATQPEAEKRDTPDTLAQKREADLLKAEAHLLREKTAFLKVQGFDSGKLQREVQFLRSAIALLLEIHLKDAPDLGIEVAGFFKAVSDTCSEGEAIPEIKEYQRHLQELRDEVKDAS